MTPERLDEIRGWLEAGASGPEWMHATFDLLAEVDRLQSLVAASMDSGHVKIVERERDEARAALRGCEQALLDGLNKLVWDDPDNWREWRTFTARPSILEAKKALGDL